MCQYINIASVGNYSMVNKTLMKMTGYPAAIYWAEICDILPHVQQKKTYDPTDGFFTLDRSYVESQIGMSTDEQKNCDAILARLGVLDVDPAKKNRIRVSMKRMTELIVDETLAPETVLPKTAKMTYAERQSSKKAGIQSMLARGYGETDPISAGAIHDLIEAYYEKGMCKSAQWKPVFDRIHAACGDPEAVRELVDFVISTNWASIPAAIDKFMEQKKPSGARINVEQKKCSGVSDIAF